MYLNNSMKQGPSWENNRSSTSQEIHRISWNQKVLYRIYKNFPPVPILSQINPVHAPYPTSCRFVFILSSHLDFGLPSGLLTSGLPTKFQYTPLLSPIPATCPAHLILLDLITCIIFGEKYIPLSSSLCSRLHSPLTSSTLGPNIVLSTLFSNTLRLCSTLLERPSFKPIQNKQNYCSVFVDFCIFGLCICQLK